VFRTAGLMRGIKFLGRAATSDPCGMSESDTDERWPPIQVARDECDLELGRPHKTGTALVVSVPARVRRPV